MLLIKYSRPKLQSIFYILTISQIYFLSSCAVLTKSQVKEIEKFSKATQEYTELPGNVILGFSKIRQTERLFDAYGIKDGELAVAQIESVVRLERTMNKFSKQADASLQILNNFSVLLQNLSADKFTEELQRESETVAKNLDKAIKEYNEQIKPTTDLPELGGYVAAAVRGIGGLYIRRQQTIILRKTIKDTEPVIEEISASNIKLLESFRSNEILSIGNAQKELDNAFKSISYPRPYSLIVAYSNLKIRVIYLNELVNNSINATKNLKTAFLRLRDGIQYKRDLKSYLEEIETYKNEVDAARKIMKSNY